MQPNSIEFICGNCRHAWNRRLQDLVKMSLAQIRCPACGQASHVHLSQVNVGNALYIQPTMTGLEGHGLVPRMGRQREVIGK